MAPNNSQQPDRRCGTSGIRPLMSQPPLHIGNLPTRIRNGDCNLLPPKFCPPSIVPPPGTAMLTCCPPQPPPMCCPPPCPPVMVVPPNFCSPYPCMPPPQCCPPPPCPPPPCQPCCIPKCCTPKPCCCAARPPPTSCGGASSCCGGGGCGGKPAQGCCNGGPKQIVCLPRGTKPVVGYGNGGGGGGGGSQKCGGGAEGGNHPFKPGSDQGASYNNCNFYLTEVPKGLRDRFGIMGNATTSTDETECTEEESSSCRDAEEDDECCEDVDPCAVPDPCATPVNRAAGDDQRFHPPLGYPGSQRVPWGAGYPGIANPPTAPQRRSNVYPTGTATATTTTGSGPGPATRRGTTSSGGARGKGCTPRGGGYGGYYQPQTQPCPPPPTYQSQRASCTPCPPPPCQPRRTSCTPCPPRTCPTSNRGRGRGSCRSSGPPPEPDDSNRYPPQRAAPPPSTTPTRNRFPPPSCTASRKIRGGCVTSGRSLMTGRSQIAKETFESQQGFRDYHYSNAELTTKSSAYLPSRYDEDNEIECIPTDSVPCNDARVGPSRPMTTRSEPTLSRNEEDGVPVYRTTTQTSLQIIERPNEDSEVRVIQRPVQELIGYGPDPNARPQHSHINLDIHTKEKKKKDPCKPGCYKPHARRLHRLCSFSNRRNKRLSQLHGHGMFKFCEPKCPIRETIASILRKHPPANCNWHEKEVPAFHEYCKTDPDNLEDVNRYPLLTRENTRADLHYESKGHHNLHSGGHHHHDHHHHDHHHHHHHELEASGGVEKRGVKRRLHHR